MCIRDRKQPEAQLAASIRRLLSNKNAERRLAGLDMMKSIRNVDFLKDRYQELLSTVREIQKPNAKEKVLIESLIGDGTEQSTTSNYTLENGFGLYNPALEVSLPPITPDTGFNVKKAFEFIRLGKAKAIFDKLNKYIQILAATATIITAVTTILTSVQGLLCKPEENNIG